MVAPRYVRARIAKHFCRTYALCTAEKINKKAQKRFSQRFSQSIWCSSSVHDFDNIRLMASFNTQAFQTQGDGFMGLGAGPGGLSFQDFGTQDASSYLQGFSQMVGETCSTDRPIHKPPPFISASSTPCLRDAPSPVGCNAAHRSLGRSAAAAKSCCTYGLSPVLLPA